VSVALMLSAIVAGTAALAACGSSASSGSSISAQGPGTLTTAEKPSWETVRFIANGSLSASPTVALSGIRAEGSSAQYTLQTGTGSPTSCLFSGGWLRQMTADGGGFVLDYTLPSSHQIMSSFLETRPALALAASTKASVARAWFSVSPRWLAAAALALAPEELRARASIAADSAQRSTTGPVRVRVTSGHTPSELPGRVEMVIPETLSGGGRETANLTWLFGSSSADPHCHS
jgi:hypothetical protein